MEPNMLGAYGPWAAALVPEGPARLSFRRDEFQDIQAWKAKALGRFVECLRMPDSGGVPEAELQHSFEFDGLTIEHLQWKLPYGPPTEAFFLKPAGAKGPLPAVLGFHCHSGSKYFGTRKIVQPGAEMNPMMKTLRDKAYGGVSWANELAKRGYAVLVADSFLFGSRRVRVADLPTKLKNGLKEVDPESEAEIKAYELVARDHEAVAAKSLFCAGTTWPGVLVGEDQRSLDYLCSRPDVDAHRVGCAGLSGGGLRAVYLGGLDERIRCACCTGMMTTWNDYLLNKSSSHTWMIYLPGLAPDLDYPEILGLRVPLPTMVQFDNEDGLFSPSGMHAADGVLKQVFQKAGAPDNYLGKFYPGPHKFDLPMQADAFAWFDRWLKA